MANINVDLSNMINSKRKVEQYEIELEKAIDNGIKEVANRLEEKMKNYMMIYGLADSGLINKVSIIQTGSGIIINVGAEYASFIEFGTGIVGAGSPHPKPFSNWSYDINSHGESGWWYPTVDSDPNPYKWVDGSGQLRAWTKGQKSKPFMYNTWLYGTRMANNVLRKHIRRIKIDN